MPQTNSPYFPQPQDHPRHPHQEVADLLAAALLRLHAECDVSAASDTDAVPLGFCQPQSVTTNPDDTNGVQL